MNLVLNNDLIYNMNLILKNKLIYNINLFSNITLFTT